jgi:protease IV
MDPSERRRRRFPWGLFVFGLCVLGAIGLCVAVFFRGPSVPERAILVVRLGEGLRVSPPGQLEALILGAGDPALPDLYRALTAALTDRRVIGVLLDLQSGSLDLADAREIRQLVGGLRAAGKKVIAYGDDLSLRAWYVASAADSVVLNPAGYLRLTGIGLRVLLFGGVFEKIGVRAELLRIGKYKTAWEAYTGSELSEDSRDAMNHLVDVSWAQLLDELSAARGIETKRLEGFIAVGPIPAPAAEEHKLVDALRWRPDLDAFVKEKIDETATCCSWRLYAEAVAGTANGTRIAYVPLAGAIMAGTQPRGFLAADLAIRHLTEAAEEPSIAAVIVRVDSPGGDALASRRLYQAIRDVRKKKPVVVSMGAMAASGGYYAAAAGDFVIAHPFTLTGSIGIFGGKLVVRELLDRIGLAHESFRRGDFAGINDPLDPLTEKARDALKRELAELYDRFIADVAEGRGVSVETIRDAAEGRVWTGKDAVERKLVDGLGGVGDAVAKAKELARIPGAVDLVLWPPAKTWYQEIFGGAGEEGSPPAAGLAGIVQEILGTGRPPALAPVALLRE